MPKRKAKKKPKWGKIGSPTSEKRKKHMKRMREQKKKLATTLEEAKKDTETWEKLYAFGKRKWRKGKRPTGMKPIAVDEMKDLLIAIIQKADKQETRLIVRASLKHNLIPPQI